MNLRKMIRDRDEREYRKKYKVNWNPSVVVTLDFIDQQGYINTTRVEKFTTDVKTTQHYVSPMGVSYGGKTETMIYAHISKDMIRRLNADDDKYHLNVYMNNRKYCYRDLMLTNVLEFERSVEVTFFSRSSSPIEEK